MTITSSHLKLMHTPMVLNKKKKKIVRTYEINVRIKQILP